MKHHRLNHPPLSVVIGQYAREIKTVHPSWKVCAGNHSKRQREKGGEPEFGENKSGRGDGGIQRWRIRGEEAQQGLATEGEIPQGKREERMPVRGGMCIKSGHRESSISDPRRPPPWPSEKDDDHFVLCVVDAIHPGGSDVVRDAPSTRRFLWYANELTTLTAGEMVEFNHLEAPTKPLHIPAPFIH